MAIWVTLDDLKNDLNLDDTRDDGRLAIDLAAAVAFVERNRSDLFADADGVPLEAPVVPADVWLGTLRLAGRFNTRRRSPDGLVDLGDLGVGRVPRIDPDIERMLGIIPTVA